MDIYNTVIKEEFNLGGPEATPQDVHSVIKEELVIEESQLLAEKCSYTYLDTTVKTEVFEEDSDSKDLEAKAFCSSRSTFINKDKTLENIHHDELTFSDSDYEADISEIRKNYKCNIDEKAFSAGCVVKKCKCDVYNKAFTLIYNLTELKLIHSGIKYYNCDVCNKAFTHSGDLSRHKLSHSSVRNYKCDVCYKAFKFRSSLSKHKLSHGSIKTYKCNACNKEFTRSYNLAIHELIHSDIKIC